MKIHVLKVQVFPVHLKLVGGSFRMASASTVRAAAIALRNRVVRTPLLQADLLNELVSHRLSTPDLRVLVKAECLQHTGAFKFRGATNRLLHLSEADRANGVVAFSSGNFAQALALAAKNLGIKCTIVAPHDAPKLKLERTRQYLADVLLSTPEEGVNREVAAAAMAEKFAADTGATLLHPFDDWHVISGQGTVAVEAYEQAREDHGVDRIDSMVVPTGGGGMLAGISLATEDMSPSTRVYSVEPQGYCDHEQSFLHPEKVRVANTGTPGVTICDALQASAPGKLTWQINSKHLSGATWMSDEAAVEAMKIAFQELKIITEPSGALGLAALLGGEIPVKKGDTVIVVACGGNVALQDYIDLLNKK